MAGSMSMSMSMSMAQMNALRLPARPFTAENFLPKPGDKPSFGILFKDQWALAPNNKPGARGNLVRPHTVLFPEDAWDAQYVALKVLFEFLDKGGLNSTKFERVKDRALFKWRDETASKAFIEEEIDDLLTHVNNARPTYLEEITAQYSDFTPFYAQLLQLWPDTHPNTLRLMQACLRVGEYVVMYWKSHYKRARPSYLQPALLPPLPVPGHASFPSGHATQAYLISGALLHAIKSSTPEVKVDDIKISGMLWRLAYKVAKNREYAGYHYRSDSLAGEKLAERTLTALTKCELFNKLLKGAKKELSKFV